MKANFLTADEAVLLVKDGDTIATGGFVGCAHPELLSASIEKRFLNDGSPRDITLTYAAGQGDGKNRGLNHFGHEGLLKRVVGGHWNLAPAMGRLAMENKIEAYNFPQGVICQLFREIAAGSPGRLTHIGLQTFVDPRMGGGKLNAKTTEDLVSLQNIDGKQWLLYKSFPIDVAFIRATSSDSFGNVSFENEVLSGEALSIAQATKNSGGTVIVQVESVVPDYSRDPKSIGIPGILIDAIVVNTDKKCHDQTFAEEFNRNYVIQGDVKELPIPEVTSNIRGIIAKRALEEILPGSVVNLGIGIPEAIATIARQTNRLDDITLTIESGPIGGIPAGGLSFGASSYPHAIIDQPYMFDYYDGGGLDIAFLGMAECDSRGNVNVSKFNGRIAGIGGFMNITQTAKKVVFTGTFTAGGLEVEEKDGQLTIIKEGAFQKFVSDVEHITFSGPYSCQNKQEVLYVTERAVFELTQDGLVLIEVASGIDIEKDILAQMAFEPKINLK